MELFKLSTDAPRYYYCSTFVSASLDMKCHWWAIRKERPAGDNGKRMRGYSKRKRRSHKVVKLWWREIQRSWSAILPDNGPRSFTTNTAVWIGPLLYNWKNNLVIKTSKWKRSAISFHCGLVSLTSLRNKIEIVHLKRRESERCWMVNGCRTRGPVDEKQPLN